LRRPMIRVPSGGKYGGGHGALGCLLLPEWRVDNII
jgi:hypothetical protein